MCLTFRPHPFPFFLFPFSYSFFLLLFLSFFSSIRWFKNLTGWDYTDVIFLSPRRSWKWEMRQCWSFLTVRIWVSSLSFSIWAIMIQFPTHLAISAKWKAGPIHFALILRTMMLTIPHLGRVNRRSSLGVSVIPANWRGPRESGLLGT